MRFSGAVAFALCAGVGPAAFAQSAPVPGGTDFHLWPREPVPISKTESIIEALWDPRYPYQKAVDRWTLRGDAQTDQLRLATTPMATFVKWTELRPGGTVEISRRYDLAIGGYRALIVRLHAGFGLRISVWATVDGKERVIAADEAGRNVAQEIRGPIAGSKLTGLRLRFAGESSGTREVSLRWVILERPGEPWKPPPHPFAATVVDGPVGKFEPGLGLVLGAAEIERLRHVLGTPLVRERWDADLKLAATRYLVDPASMFRQYSLYSLYEREADEHIDPSQDGLALAIVGLLAKREDYLRQAARHAMVFAYMDEWADSFIDVFADPAPRAYAAFAPNVALIKASLLLDFTWHYLTPEGRRLLRQAIREKGIRRLEPMLRPGFATLRSNQGGRFLKGLVLGKMAVSDNWSDPRLRAEIQFHLEQLNSDFGYVVADDGTFTEGSGYGKGTLASMMLTYQAISRCLNRPLRQIVPEGFLKAMRFVVESERTLAPAFAAFAAGPLGDREFDPYTTPSSLLDGSEYSYVEQGVYGLNLLWAPRLIAKAGEPVLPDFSVYPKGGWVFMGSRDAAMPRVTFETGLWTGFGHSWLHSNAITLDGWGEPLLITRFHVAYADARYRFTARTEAYNTFAPSGRDQDASGTPGRGSKLAVAEDLGPVAVVDADNATAWKSGVELARRRVILIRPQTLVIEDTGRFTEAEPGIQSWNAFGSWRPSAPHAFEMTYGPGKVRVTLLTPDAAQEKTGQDFVHRVRGEGEMPVFRTEFASPRAQRHHMLTLVEAAAAGAEMTPARILRRDPVVIEVRSGDEVTRVVSGRVSAGLLWDVESDGSFNFATRRGESIVCAGAFDATFVRSRQREAKGNGFVRLERH